MKKMVASTTKKFLEKNRKITSLTAKIWKMEAESCLKQISTDGFNPRLFFHLYMGKLHPDAQYLFSREQREKKGFNLKSNPTVWYEKNKLGINEVSKATPLL